tara:strand:- start:1628 stop:2122 length:495 start_codon:yes stop_codon:yes gene_type:complete
MASNIKVISLKPSKSKLDELLGSSEKIKEILKKKIQKPKELNFNLDNESTFRSQFINRCQTRKKSIEERTRKNKKKTMKDIKQEFFEAKTKPVIPNKDVLSVFHSVIKKKNMSLTNKFIRLITRNQLLLILSSLSIVKKKSKAPTPLLKNLLYNFITSTIHIIS